MTDAPTPPTDAHPSPNAAPPQREGAGSGARTPSAIDAIADEYVRQVCALSPITATYIGLLGDDHALEDFSPSWYDDMAALDARTLARVDAAEPVDEVDRVTVAAMTERLGLAGEIHQAGHDLAELNNISSPLQRVRDTLDLMATSTQEDWAAITSRLAAVPGSLSGWMDSLRLSADRGQVPARRQVEACIDQCAAYVADGGQLERFVAGAATDDGPLPASLAADLATAAAAAGTAYRDLAEALGQDIAPRARDEDACGRQTYALMSRSALGATVDLDETYAWGQEELARITQQMRQTADQIRPGATVAEAIEHLDADPAYRLDGTEALREWMQVTANDVVADLGESHFDIPGPVQTIECRIAPSQTGGIYYTGPSDDFTRPGRMWWSVPPDVTRFGTWRELTTVYHEGVPGHHLQIAQTTYRRDLLNTYRRLLLWTSGHGEGWALYAERLMDELGYFADPGMRLGFLDSQAMRAARVVLDIGVHCHLSAPAEVGGGEWTYDKAWQFLTAHANMDHATLRFELDRYLGWPGQAPSYKVGERVWMQLRDRAEQDARTAGRPFDLAVFHRRALDIGSVGLDVLAEALAT